MGEALNVSVRRPSLPQLWTFFVAGVKENVPLPVIIFVHVNIAFMVHILMMVGITCPVSLQYKQQNSVFFLFCFPLDEKENQDIRNNLICTETEHYFMQLFLWLCKLFDQRGLDIPP